MKVGLLAPRDKRHLAFGNMLANKLNGTVCYFSEQNPASEVITVERYSEDPLTEYFRNVRQAESKFFSDIDKRTPNLKWFEVKSGDFNRLARVEIEAISSCDLVIVFGTRLLKGATLELLMNLNCLNVHAGVAPFYRGSSCNFWAQKDGNFGLVGVTLHKLSPDIDQGEILAQFIPTKTTYEGFEFSMWVLFRSLQEISTTLTRQPYLSFEFKEQDRSKEIRYSVKADFNPKLAEAFLECPPKLNKINLSIRDNQNTFDLKNAIFFD